MTELRISTYEDYLDHTPLKVCDSCQTPTTKTYKYLSNAVLCEDCYVTCMTEMGEERV